MSEHDRLRGAGEHAHWQIDNFMLAPTWVAPTFTNSWVDYGGVEMTARYCIDGWGFVHLAGAIKSGTGAGAFTLPVGFRPSARVWFQAAGAGDTDVYIGTDGVVTISTTDTSRVHLDGIYFFAG